MEYSANKKIVSLVVGLCFGLLLMGALRLSAVYSNILTPFSRFATPGYILITVIFTIFLVRAGLPLNRFGFGIHPDFRQLILAIAAIALLRLFAVTLNPLIEDFFGSPRNLERFANVKGSIVSLVVLLVTNWTIAAFGEEFAYRIVILRGISFILGDTPTGKILAVLLQAVMFGLIHTYQGPTGISGSMFSGLVFGTVTIVSRWSIWPAAVAHGLNNTIGIFALFHG